MPIFNSGYWKFDVYNVFDVLSLSSFALEQTPLKFLPTNYKDRDYSNRLILWDFGDGSTQVKGLSAQHFYFYPGQYSVTMTVMTQDGNTVIDSYNSKVNVYDFVPNTFNFNLSTLSLSSGIYSNELKINRFNSLQSYSNSGYTFYLNASGSNSFYFDKNKLKNEPYAHLLPTHRFIEREVYFNSQNKIVNNEKIVNEVKTIDTFLYGKLDADNLVVKTDSTDNNSFFVGTSGYVDNLYFVDDFAKDEPYWIFSTLNTSNFPNNYTKYYKIPLNSDLPINNSYSFYTKILKNSYIRPTNFSITSNGLDGESKTIKTFNIHPSKYQNQIISFVAKLKTNTFNNKNLNFFLNPGYLNFALNTVSIDLYTGDDIFIASLEPYISFDETLFKDNRYGWVKGYVVIPNELINLYSEDARYKLVANCDLEDDTGTFSLSGSSSIFNLLPKQGYNKIAKINENFDTSTYLKNLALQPSIYKRPQIFDTFFGTTLGTLSSETNAIGKRIYEKTSNFIINNVNIDTCEIKNLFGFALEYNVDLDDYASTNLLINYPSDLSRLVNLFSIKQSLLFGKRNLNQTNFKNNYAKLDNSTIEEAAYNYSVDKNYGNNLGDEISIGDGLITKSEDFIVAYEKFSEKYTILRTFNNNIETEIYPLSSFDNSWGWGLVLPNDFFNTYSYINNLSSYYSFYRFIPVVPGEWDNNIINWDDIYQTTIDIGDDRSNLNSYYPEYFNAPGKISPLNRWYSYGGVIDQNLNYQLSVGLELLSAN